MQKEKNERRILWISFLSGLIFAFAELVFAIYSRSQSALMDAVYDSSELIFIILVLFLTPLFHKPISEKRPFGYFQVESVFLIIKGFAMLAVTFTVAAGVVEKAFNGGNLVNNGQVALFQLCVGVVSLGVLAVMNYLNRSVSSLVVKAEILGWKMDVGYSFGMAAAFFGATFLAGTRFEFIAPYFDQLMAVLVMVIMLPECLKMLIGAIKDVFLFSPDKELVEEIKSICQKDMENKNFQPKFFDITRTGRHLWVAVYFAIEEDKLAIKDLREVSENIDHKLKAKYSDVTCELILIP